MPNPSTFRIVALRDSIMRTPISFPLDEEITGEPCHTLRSPLKSISSQTWLSSSFALIDVARIVKWKLTSPDFRTAMQSMGVASDSKSSGISKEPNSLADSIDVKTESLAIALSCSAEMSTSPTDSLKELYPLASWTMSYHLWRLRCR